MEDMIFLPVGYPVQFKNIDSTYRYEIENMQGTHLLESNEFMLWTELLRKSNEADTDPAALNSLKEKKAILYAESGNTLFSLLFAYVPVRQGFGGIAENRYCIVLGEKNFFPSKLQMDFWELSDGNKTVLEILRILAKEHSIVSSSEKEEFVKQIKGLMTYSLLFLK